MADNKWLRNGFVWMILIIAAIAVWVTFVQGGRSGSSITTQELAADIKAGKVEQLTMSSGSDEVQVHYIGSNEVRTLRLPTNVDIFELLQTYGIDPKSVSIRVNPASQWGNWLGTLTFLLPTLFLIGVIIFMMRQAQGTNNQALSFGKSRARVFTSNRPTVTFDDVAGVDEAKEELQEIVEFLKYPEKFAALGARIPRGVLLVGPPGTGKTLLSRAVAGEAGVPFFSISGSEFVEMFVGVGASRVRDLFDQAKRNAPCIVFIDEIDAVGRQRGAGLGGSHDEREQTLNQILVEMDGFDSSTNVIVLAATNRPDVLDPALLRPGRFDRQVVLDRPDLHGRLAILKVHTRGKPLESDVDLEDLARQTPGFSGADLENLVNEAAILAARRNKKTIGRRELYEAIDRVVAGPERKSRRISEREKLMTAYHEAGHALVARMLPHADPVHKVSIVARGMMGGYTRVLPEEDRFFWTKKQFEAQLAVFMAGLVAEELVFQEISTGAANDIERATTLARRMVTEFGMSERLGPLAFGRKEELIFLGREIAEQRNYSDQVAYEIDQEVRRLIDQAYQTAKNILMQHMDKLEKIATLLVEKETIEGHEIEALFDEPRPRPELVGPPVTKPAALMRTPEPPQTDVAPESRPTPAPQIRPQPAS
ncbi:ATP-dependent zinc metalloprotease FtsH [bacterium HR28]|jgi:cell division protease FtsH|uniref:ATP-dependent zinc metalloprotease FtsH n=1 Tax=Thermomicrobium roseum TaxID=500 RepID=A0A7C1G3Q8_THERO|nr:ATP-dependent zinc metalloprotease FtsH [bacterium HR28]